MPSVIQEKNALGEINSPSALLQRRPLPKTQTSEKQDNHKVKFRGKKKLSKSNSKENVERYWNSSIDVDSWRYPSFDHYPGHNQPYDLYCLGPRGPNPFPRRSPRRLPKLIRKSKQETLPGDTSSEMLSHFKLDLHIQLPGFSSRGRITYSHSKESDFPHHVSQEEEVFRKEDITDLQVYTVPLHAEEKKLECKQILLEKQLLEIDRLLSEKGGKQGRVVDGFWDRNIDNYEEENDMTPRISSFRIAKSILVTESYSSHVFQETSFKEITESCRDLREICCATDKEKTVLDLRASYSDYLPKIGIRLTRYLAWVNLSYNYFTTIPEQLYELESLISLNMRNNPIAMLPGNVNKMEKLRSLDLSHCKLESIDKSVFLLSNLLALDISYNLIKQLPHEIGNLRVLRELSVEGNKLGYLPGTLLKLDLYSLRCNLNFTSRVFWREMCPKEVLSLVNAAMLALVVNDQMFQVPADIRKRILLGPRCPYCNVLIPGSGLAALKPAQELFGVKNLPLLFNVCSQTCKINFQRSTDISTICDNLV